MRTTRHILILSLLLGTLVTNAQENLALIDKAFKKGSIQLYEDFLFEWQGASAPLKSKDSLSCIEKDIYEIFEDFYNPFNLERVGSGEFGAELYSKVDYIVVQNSIYSYTYNTDSIDFGVFDQTDTLLISKDSIDDFRPNVKFFQAGTLCLTPTYELSLYNFLGTKHHSLGKGGIMNPAHAKGNSEKRLKFLNKKLHIIHGHWGGYWHISTHPFVFNIDFNKDRSIAKVHYRIVYQGGEANYKKENGKWVFNDASLTWIE